MEKVIEKIGETVTQATASITKDEKAKQLLSNTVEDAKKGNIITTDFGTPITNTTQSLKVGETGPVLIEDFHLREKITHFDHERIPERVVHARGAGAHGFFQPYESLAQYTSAQFLCDPSKKTPVFVRFSTVVGSRGSADTVRDVRGFATKFYTEQGNFDIVGNNIPVFFIQDAIRFPDLIHAAKPEPHNEIPQAQTAHDNFWDFISLTPESTHMIMWTLSDRAIPRSYRMMQGFGVNTFVFVNAEGARTFVKFHWIPLLGVHSLVWDESQKLCGIDPDFHRRDLWEAIESGHYPEWQLGVQLVTEKEAEKFDFDVLDPTKIIPEEMVPMKLIGKMVLNRNPDNFFAETEQVAFHAGHLVPGIEASNDPLLQGRLFSYVDTQITRLGGPNFEEIPINLPVCPVTNFQRDGFHRMTVNKGTVNYFPNRLGCPAVASIKHGYTFSPVHTEGPKVPGKGPKFEEVYKQARMFFTSLSNWEKDHLIRAACFELGRCDDVGVRERMIATLNKVDFDMACQIAKAIGVPPPTEPKTVKITSMSPAVSQAYYQSKDSIQSRRVAFLVGPGFNWAQFNAISSFLAASGAVSIVIGPFKGEVTGDSGSTTAQFAYFTCKSVMFDAVVIVGGTDSIKTLSLSGDAKAFVMEAFKHGKAIIAVEEGTHFIQTLSLPKLMDTRKGSQLVTSQGVVTLPKFTGTSMKMKEEADQQPSLAKAMFDAIAAHRHFDRDDLSVPVS